ncbi:MAG: response regulator transcription factor [Collinsella sp.]|nr:response regulator transcription factor [Collinsella sp.]
MNSKTADQHILVVEDDSAVRSLISTALEVHELPHVAVQTGEAAILEAATHNPSLILLDLGLPDLDGMEVITKIRSWSVVPIIVISARSEDNDKIRALDAGADDYLTKPFSVDELLARVRAWMRRNSMGQVGEAQSSVFENGPLTIDFAAGCAYLDGTELHLTPIEYKLLTLMAKNAGKVLTHAFITHEIWGTSWESDIASLRVFMATLRKKIEPGPDHPRLIQTHVGIGYRMQRL